jgi:hypothetical protein
MRRDALLASLVALSTCGPLLGSPPAPADPAAGTGSSQPLFSWRFLGGARLAGDTNASRIRVVLAQPASQLVLSNTLNKLARSPVLWGQAAAVGDRAEALRPAFNELLQAESVGVCTVAAGGKVDWTVAVRSSSGLRHLTPAAWAGLVAALGAGAPASVALAATSAQEVRWANSTTWSRWAQANGWTLLGLGAGTPRAFDTLLAEIAGVKPDGAWLTVKADLSQVARALGSSGADRFPQANLDFVGRGPNVRMSGKFLFAEALKLKTEPWRIPTNTVTDPVVGFTAVQGIQEWLGRQAWWRELGLAGTPNQMFGWAMAEVPFANYYAWLLSDPTNALRQIAPTVPAFLTNQIPRIGFGHVEFDTNRSRVVWYGLPVAEPFLAPADPRDGDFVFAGVFPLVRSRTPVPSSLLSQVTGRPDMLYYDWEITQERVNGWRHLKNLTWMLSGYVPPPTNGTGEAWLTSTNVQRHLGNAATEITQSSPRELAVVRSSSVGLTGFELVALMRWLDDPTFPRLNEPPLLPKRERRPQPAAPAPTNAPAPAHAATPARQP